MDYVPAHGNTAMLDDREDVSGARVFDGEDQGKKHFYLVREGRHPVAMMSAEDLC